MRGVILTGIFSGMKTIFADSCMAIASAQTGLAAVQPFILNADTKVVAQWFPKMNVQSLLA